MNGYQEKQKYESALNVNPLIGIDLKSLHCQNGGCIRPKYRGRVCFRCWAGIKWTSVKQRVENKNGNNPSYQGIPLGFTKETLISWVLNNPPLLCLTEPSIDRIVPALGYVFGNIRWIEKRKNSAGSQRDVEDGFRICAKCKRKLPLTSAFFGINRGKKWGAKLQTYCSECGKVAQREWNNRHKERLKQKYQKDKDMINLRRRLRYAKRKKLTTIGANSLV